MSTPQPRTISKAKAALVAASLWLRTTVADKWADFRARSKYFQAKVFLLVAYGGLVFVTVVWAPPPRHNDIDASVLFSKDVLLGPYLLVENKGGNDWTNIAYTINQSFTINDQAKKTLVAGGRVQLFLEAFRAEMYSKKKKKTIKVKPKADLELQELRIDTEQGSALIDLTKLKTNEALR